MIDKSKYKHIFFDLDHTLWDFEKNSYATLEQLYDSYSLRDMLGAEMKVFYDTYSHYNNFYWNLFEKKEITRETLRYIRFKKTLEKLGAGDEHLPTKLAEHYLQLLPEQGHLMRSCIEVLEYLYPKYHLHIITNGFDKVQRRKLQVSGLQKYFTEIITSEMAQAQKPDTEIFNYTFRLTGADNRNSIFIGDSYEADISGAINANMDYIFFNPALIKPGIEIMCEIKELDELKQLL